MQITNARIGEVIANLRRERGFSQEELAEKAGIHRTYVSQLERGLKSPTLAILIKIADALGINCSDILKAAER